MAIVQDVLEGVDLSFDVGSLEMGLATSAIQVVMADEVIEVARGMLRGVPTDDESLAIDVFREVGIGGDFLANRHTTRHQRELWIPTLTSWESRRLWEERGSRSMRERARERAVELIASHRPPDLPEAMIGAMGAIVDARRAAAGSGRPS